MTVHNANSIDHQLVRTANFGETLVAPVTNIVRQWLPQRASTRTWLQTIAFRVALKRAYNRFAEAHPEAVKLFFDEYFLRRNAAPLLARYIDGQTPPTPAQIANVWDRQIGPASDAVRRRRIADLTPISANFLNILESELKIRA